MSLFSKKQSAAPRRRLQADGSAGRATDSGLEQRYAFRRNRTLTGSASSNVASTTESNAQLKSSRVQAHELTSKRRRIGAVLLLVLVGCFGLYGLISQFTVGVVVKAQNTASDDLNSTYEKIIESYFSSRPIERLRFLIDADYLSKYVQSQAPEVARVQVDGSAGFGKSVVMLVMREPIAGWNIRGHQQYVDSSGTAFGRNYFALPAIQIIDNSSAQTQTGQAVASNRFLGFVGRTVGLANTGGYKVQQVIIPAGTTREVELRLEGVAFPIKLSVDRSAGEQVEDMTRVLKWLQARGRSAEYVDVRIAGKAFYK